MSVARGKATDFSCVTMKNITMKGANFLEKLLDNQPVEWKKLGEVCIHLRTGLNPRNNFKLNTDDARNYYVTVRELRGTEIVYTEKTDRVNDEGLKLINNRSQLKKDDILFSATGTIGKTALITEEPKDWNIKEGVYALTIDKTLVLPKFFLRYIQSKHAIDWILQRAMGSTVVSIPMKELNKLPIPVPPLSVQSRIVEILDKFTAMEAELEEQLQAELELRKKQYAYYCEQLLNFSYTPPSEFNVVYKKLGEVCKVQRGASPRPITKYLTDDKLNGIPWIKIGDTKVGEKYIEDTQERITQEGARKSRLLQKGDFVLSNSMSYGRPYILGISGCIHDGWASLSEISNSVLPDYLYYYLSSNEVQHYWTGKINSGSVSNLNSEIIKQLPIPIPPLSEQARIVEILDKFDTLTNSISEGLPLEIQLRKQQYEYYREQLLAFPHP